MAAITITEGWLFGVMSEWAIFSNVVFLLLFQTEEHILGIFTIIETIILKWDKENVTLNLKKKSIPNHFRKEKMIVRVLNEKISKVRNVTEYL